MRVYNQLPTAYVIDGEGHTLDAGGIGEVNSDEDRVKHGLVSGALQPVAEPEPPAAEAVADPSPEGA